MSGDGWKFAEKTDTWSRQMRFLTAGSIATCTLCGSSVVFADMIEAVNFSFTDPNAGNLVASGTLAVNLTSSQALTGSGSINSSLFVASDDLWHQGDVLDWDFLGYGGPPMQGQVYNTSSSGITVTPARCRWLLLSALGGLTACARRPGGETRLAEGGVGLKQISDSEPEGGPGRCAQ